MSTFEYDLELLNVTIANGGAAVTSTLIDCLPYDGLVERGWLLRVPDGPHRLKYTVTECGRRAAADHKKSPPA